VGLRISSLIFALASLGLLARVWARPESVIGSYHLGRVQSLICVVITGVLGIWLAKLAGPWSGETKVVRASKV